MRKVVASAIALAFIMTVIGCATLPMESKLEKPVCMTKVTNAKVKDFTETKKALWLFWGAMPLVLPTLDETVGPAVADHAGVQNLKITTQYDLIDLIVTTITEGIVTMQSVTISGEAYE